MESKNHGAGGCKLIVLLYACMCLRWFIPVERMVFCSSKSSLRLGALWHRTCLQRTAWCWCLLVGADLGSSSCQRDLERDLEPRRPAKSFSLCDEGRAHTHTSYQNSRQFKCISPNNRGQAQQGATCFFSFCWLHLSC